LCRQHGEWIFARAPNITLYKNNGPGAPSFQNLLKDDMFRKDFTNFLCLQFCVENLFFWEAVQQFHSVAQQELKTAAKGLFDKYLAAGAAYEVNIPISIKKALDAQIKAGVFSNTMFDDAAAQTLKLMELDSYPRFVSRPGVRVGVHSQASRERLML